MLVPVERTQRVVIRHPDTRAVATVNANAVKAWERRGWLVVDSNTPKPVVLDAADQLGVPVNPDATRGTIVDQLTAVDPNRPPTPPIEHDHTSEED